MYSIFLFLVVVPPLKSMHDSLTLTFTPVLGFFLIEELTALKSLEAKTLSIFSHTLIEQHHNYSDTNTSELIYVLTLQLCKCKNSYIPSAIFCLVPQWKTAVECLSFENNFIILFSSVICHCLRKQLLMKSQFLFM